jgi:hypothetical protein
MPDDSIWIAVTSDGTVTAWDDVDAARNHLRDDDGDVWVEHVTINRTTMPQDATGAPSGDADDEDAPDGPPTAHSAAYRRTWMAAPRLIYPERPRGETA